MDIAPRILTASTLLRDLVYRTPLEPAPWLLPQSGAEVHLKLECLQRTGSFKVRGALTALDRLDPETRSRGIVTASAGNHGLGVAYAAGVMETPATIVVPESASPAKLAALRRSPVTVRVVGAGYDEAEREGRRLAHEMGAAFVSPYNDPWVIAGQGTIGVELLEDLPDLDLVLVPVGGGGLVAGVGCWVKAVKPSVRVIGVQPEASPSMQRALQAGRAVEIPIAPTLADGLEGNIEEGSITIDLALEVVDDIVLVSEKEIAGAVREVYDQLHLALEPSAVVSIAALLSRRVPEVSQSSRIAVLLTGRNVSAELLCRLLAPEG